MIRIVPPTEGQGIFAGQRCSNGNPHAVVLHGIRKKRRRNLRRPVTCIRAHP